MRSYAFSIDPDDFYAITRQQCTANIRSESQDTPFSVGDHITFYEYQPNVGRTGQFCRVRITDVTRNPELYPGFALLSFQLEPNVPATISTPGGTLTVIGAPHDEYPGYDIAINGQLAASVEWHPVQQALMIRTYTAQSDDPVTYYHWATGNPFDETDVLHTDEHDLLHMYRRVNAAQQHTIREILHAFLALSSPH
ncbi:DUF3850 domain-containing protein [Sulfobacillus thermosulfidooxidans]|uniref:DUF3850 domain-containing protein n=1 Tax=Sulfobacillus thermosulfidooxidans TaxID=28034 RepID=UPI0006B4338F|nr:DUF3850 domain-containing protein [Sulfobacillus thermosulfidooxidans]